MMRQPALSFTVKAYSTSGSDPNPNQNPNNSRNSLPKLRYFFLIMALGTVGFLGALKLVGEKKSRGEMSEEQYEALKAQPKKRAFDPKEAFVVFVLGGPGSGKGTQCANIVRDYNFCHLSAGDLLRAEQQRPGSKHGELIRSNIQAGKIVPQEVTISLLRNAMAEQIKQGTSQFLIDGFPRAMQQALTFEETVVPSRFTLFFDCPEDTMLKRLLNRGKTSDRIDDNIDSIKMRFKTFVNDSMPVVEYFDVSGKVAKLNCDQPVEEVYKKVQETLEKHGISKRYQKA